MKKIDVEDLITFIFGGIYPIGETNYDKEALKNLSGYEDFLIKTIEELIEIAEFKTHCAYSLKESGKKSHEILVELKNIIDFYFEMEEEKKENRNGNMV